MRDDIIQGDLSGPEPGIVYPQWLRDRLEWFADLKFGLFIHWGIYAQWGCIESWPLVPDDTWARPDDLAAWNERGRDLARFQRDYRALNRTFNPTAFDPEAWAEAAERAGMRYVAFTTKHHDGFCMFDTATTDYRITHPDCPFHTHPDANVTRRVFDAFRRRRMGISCYFSKSDWHCPWYWHGGAPIVDRNPNYDTAAHPERWARFVEFVHAQVRELMSDYGSIDVLWLDGGQVRPPAQDIRMDELVAMARRQQPGLIVADRTVGGEHENILTPEQTVPDEPLTWYWESCLTMGQGWSHRPDDHYKSARQLIHLLVDVVAKGGNLLLNVGPDPMGRLDPVAVDRLREIGDWMRTNGEAIYATRPLSPFLEDNIRYTRKGEIGYAIVLPDSNHRGPPTNLHLPSVRPRRDGVVRLLGVDAALDWRAEGHGCRVTIPEPIARAQAGDHAWVLRFELDPSGQTQSANAMTPGVTG